MNFENKVISREIQQFLYDSNKTLGTAESCTGGRIAEVIAAVPGASNYFKGGIIAYSNELKIRLLGVNAQVIEEQSAVCEEVATQMAVGLCQTINCDYAIAITGIAGPGGGTHGMMKKRLIHTVSHCLSTVYANKIRCYKSFIVNQ